MQLPMTRWRHRLSSWRRPFLHAFGAAAFTSFTQEHQLRNHGSEGSDRRVNDSKDFKCSHRRSAFCLLCVAAFEGQDKRTPFFLVVYVGCLVRSLGGRRSEWALTTSSVPWNVPFKPKSRTTRSCCCCRATPITHGRYVHDYDETNGASEKTQIGTVSRKATKVRLFKLVGRGSQLRALVAVWVLGLQSQTPFRHKLTSARCYTCSPNPAKFCLVYIFAVLRENGVALRKTRETAEKLAPGTVVVPYFPGLAIQTAKRQMSTVPGRTLCEEEYRRGLSDVLSLQ